MSINMKPQMFAKNVWINVLLVKMAQPALLVQKVSHIIKPLSNVKLPLVVMVLLTLANNAMMETNLMEMDVQQAALSKLVFIAPLQEVVAIQSVEIMFKPPMNNATMEIISVETVVTTNAN